jgi:hypothetical protein
VSGEQVICSEQATVEIAAELNALLLVGGELFLKQPRGDFSINNSLKRLR